MSVPMVRLFPTASRKTAVTKSGGSWKRNIT
nr:MAG TPA_asm: hypothetical protein [Bacteriophage sp.]